MCSSGPKSLSLVLSTAIILLDIWMNIDPQGPYRKRDMMRTILLQSLVILDLSIGIQNTKSVLFFFSLTDFYKCIWFENLWTLSNVINKTTFPLKDTFQKALALNSDNRHWSLNQLLMILRRSCNLLRSKKARTSTCKAAATPAKKNHTVFPVFSFYFRVPGLVWFLLCLHFLLRWCFSLLIFLTLKRRRQEALQRWI